MRRRKLAGVIGVMVGIGLLSGCAKTPESSLVKQKGKGAMKNYEEATELASDKSGAGDGSETGGGTGASDESGTGNESGTGGGTGAGNEAGAGNGTGIGGEAETGGEAAENGGSAAGAALRERLQAPEHYQSEVTDATGNLKIITDAAVELPAADQLPVIAVTQHPFDQEKIDQITEAFFSGAKIYDGEKYFAMTKAEWQARLEELKGYVAEGNLDPYGFGTQENGELVYDIYESIEQIEQNIAEAPEERIIQEIHPQFGQQGTEYDDGAVDDLYFFGIVEMPDGTRYDYILNAYDSMPMEVKIYRRADWDEVNMQWSEYEPLKAYYMDVLPSEEEVRQEIGISLEEAQQLADEKVRLLGIPEMELAASEPVLKYQMGDMREDSGTDYSRERLQGAGYQLHYTRRINKVPVTFTASYGGSLEDMESEMETWCYERLDFIVSKNGIEQVNFLNQYDVGEARTENPKLLSFSEIFEIYEKMMLIQNADVINYEGARTYHIDKINLGYGRIYEPATDSKSGLLVPVWNFFGSFDYSYENEGVTETGTSGDMYASYLTINAVDGSVIDLELGY